MSRYIHDSGEKPASRSSEHVFNELHGRESAWRRRGDAKSINISPELFEKIYLNPMSSMKGKQDGRFAVAKRLWLLRVQRG